MVRCGGVRRVLVVGFLVLASAYVHALTQAPTGRAAAAQQPRVYANMLQVMRGVLYPASNVIFTAQIDDPGVVQAGNEHTSTSSDPFTSAYGGWEAVENSGMALAEAANLLIICGRPASRISPRRSRRSAARRSARCSSACRSGSRSDETEP